jgi:hypothetical protein
MVMRDEDMVMEFDLAMMVVIMTSKSPSPVWRERQRERSI